MGAVGRASGSSGESEVGGVRAGGGGWGERERGGGVKKEGGGA